MSPGRDIMFFSSKEAWTVSSSGGSSASRRSNSQTSSVRLPALLGGGAVDGSPRLSRHGSGAALLSAAEGTGDSLNPTPVINVGESCSLPPGPQMLSPSWNSAVDSGSPASPDGSYCRKTVADSKSSWTRKTQLVRLLFLLAMCAALCSLIVYISWTLLSVGQLTCHTAESRSPSMAVGEARPSLNNMSMPMTTASERDSSKPEIVRKSMRSDKHDTMPGQPSSSLMMVTAIPPVPCSGNRGDFRNLQSVLNKVDYTRLHSYDLYIGTKLEHGLFGGPWNKVALLQRLMRDTNYEWFMWVDMDTVIEDMTFRVLMASYTNKSLIIWGNETELFQNHNSRTGINTGIFLLRNNQWSRDFLAKVMQFGEKYYNKNQGTEMDQRMSLHQDLPGYDFALFDQNGFAHELYHNQSLMSHVVFENSYVLNGYWNDTNTYSGPTFINHFSGCQFCSGIRHGSGHGCHQAYTQSFHSARAMSESLIRPAVAPDQGKQSSGTPADLEMGLP